MRCFLSWLIMACLLLSPIRALAVADDEIGSKSTFEQTNSEVALREAQAAILVEAGTLQVLSSLEADTAFSVAGLCKLPAILVIAEAVDQGVLSLSSQVTVSRRAAGIGGPSAFLEADERIEGTHLMKAAAMICAGDAIMALGEHAFGTESAFVERIQNRLTELGINTAYEDGVGKGAQFSPRMLAILGAALMQSDSFTAYSKLTYEVFTHEDGRETELANANKLLRDYAGCTGVATGSSQADGYCGVFGVIRGDTQLIAVVLGAKNANARFEAASSMLDEAFAQKRAQTLAKKGDVLAENVRVRGGKSRMVNLVAKDTVVLLLEKADPVPAPVEDIPEYIVAPLSTSEVVGSIVYKDAQGATIGKVELVPQNALEKSILRDCVRTVLLTFLRM